MKIESAWRDANLPQEVITYRAPDDIPIDAPGPHGQITDFNVGDCISLAIDGGYDRAIKDVLALLETPGRFILGRHLASGLLVREVAEAIRAGEARGLSLPRKTEP